MSGRKPFKRTFTLPKEAVQIATVPVEAEVIYFLSRKGQCVYVGQSQNVLKRLGSHVEDKEFDAAWAMPVSASQDALLEEAHWINWYRPEYNKAVPAHLPYQRWYPHRFATEARRKKFAP